MSKNGAQDNRSARVVRGLIFGLIWGVIFMGFVLGVTSLLMPLPDRGATAPVVVVEAPEPDPEPIPEPTVVIENIPEPSPSIEAPGFDAAPEIEETSAIIPEAGAADTALTEVLTEDETVPAMSEGDMPSASEQPAAPLVAPMSENDLAISTEPAQPVSPVVQEEAFEQPVADVDEPEVKPDPPNVSDVAETAVAEPEAELASVEGATVAVVEEGAAVVINRLPSVSDTGSPREDGPLAVNSEMFENPGSRPLMSIVLIDTGDFNIGPEALAAFPYPLTFAIDPLREDALEKAQTYRNGGFELVALADLPQNGGAELAELALLPTLDGVPGFVGALEGLDGGVQGNMELAEAVLKAMGDAGYGLLLRPKGLNAAQQMADGRDLPVATIFRDFDDKGQDATVIRRFLDQAAFKARQEGEIIMVGRLRPATISALLLWGLQDRATSVALAPVSAILLN